MNELQIEQSLIQKLSDLKYVYRPDITDRVALERNFREKFEELNRIHLTDSEFARLLDEIVTPDVFIAAKTIRNINSFTRDDDTPLNYMLVNIRDWCKNDFEVINQLRINTDNSHHRYDVILLINGVPCVQIELKTLGVNPRRADARDRDDLIFCPKSREELKLFLFIPFTGSLTRQRLCQNGTI